MAGSGSLSKSVSLRIVTDAGTAKQTIDDIAAKADNLNGKRSSLVVNVSSGDTKAQLDEITAKADALGIKNVQFKVKADTAEANAKLDETKAKADSLGRSFLGAALGISGFGDATAFASEDASMFQKVLAGVNLATGVLEPLMAGAIVTVGGLASGLVAAGAGAGVFALAAKGAFTDVTNADTANQKLTGGLGELQTSLKSATAEYNSFIQKNADGVAHVLAPAFALLPTILKSIQPLLPPVEAAFSGIIKTVSAVIDPVQQVDTVVRHLGSGITGIDETTVHVSGSFQSFIKMLASNAGPAITKIATAIGHIIVGLGGIVRAFMPVSQTILSGLDKLTAKFAAWGATLSGHSGFQSLMTMFKTETPMAIQVLKNLATTVLGFGKAMTGLDGVGNSKMLLQILEPLTGLLAKLANGNPVLDRTVLYMLMAVSAGGKLKNVFTSIAGTVGGVQSAAKSVSNFSAGFKDADKAASTATGSWGTFGGKISGLGDTLKNAAVKMGILRTATVEGTEAQEGMDIAMEANPIGIIIMAVVALVAIILVLTLKCSAFRDFWKAVWKDIKIAFDDAFNWIKQNWMLIVGILTLPIGGAVLIILKYWTQIKDGFVAAFNAIKSFFSAAWHDILSGAESMVTGLYDWFIKIPADIIKALASLGADMFNIGVNIIWGVIKGVENEVGTLFGYLESVAKDIGNVFSSVLHIFSPSRLFQSFGQYTMQGFINGVKSMRTQVVGTMAETANAAAGAWRVATPAASMGAAGSAGSSGQRPINITVSGLVGDAAATGRQLAESLNEYLRQTGQPELVGGV